MTEHHSKKWAWASIISGALGVIALIGVFSRLAVTRAKIDDLTVFQEKQEIINSTNIASFATINESLNWIKDYLKTNLK